MKSSLALCLFMTLQTVSAFAAEDQPRFDQNGTLVMTDPAKKEWVAVAVNRRGVPGNFSGTVRREREFDGQVRTRYPHAPLGTVTGYRQDPDGDFFVYRGAFRDFQLVGDSIYLTTFGGLGLASNTGRVDPLNQYRLKPRESRTTTRLIVGASVGLKLFKCSGFEVRDDVQTRRMGLEQDGFSRKRLDNTVRIQHVRYLHCNQDDSNANPGLKEETDRLLGLLDRAREARGEP